MVNPINDPAQVQARALVNRQVHSLESSRHASSRSLVNGPQAVAEQQSSLRTSPAVYRPHTSSCFASASSGAVTAAAPTPIGRRQETDSDPPCPSTARPSRDRYRVPNGAEPTARVRAKPIGRYCQMKGVARHPSVRLPGLIPDRWPDARCPTRSFGKTDTATDTAPGHLTPVDLTPNCDTASYHLR